MQRSFGRTPYSVLFFPIFKFERQFRTLCPNVTSQSRIRITQASLLICAELYVECIRRIHRDTHFAFEIGTDLDSKLPFNLLLSYVRIIHTFPSLRALRRVRAVRVSSSFTMCKIYAYSRSRIDATSEIFQMIEIFRIGNFEQNRIDFRRI